LGAEKVIKTVYYQNVCNTHKDTLESIIELTSVTMRQMVCERQNKIAVYECKMLA